MHFKNLNTPYHISYCAKDVLCYPQNNYQQQQQKKKQVNSIVKIVEKKDKVEYSL